MFDAIWLAGLALAQFCAAANLGYLGVPTNTEKGMLGGAAIGTGAGALVGRGNPAAAALGGIVGAVDANPAQRTQVQFTNSAGMKVYWFTQGTDRKPDFGTTPRETPCRYNFTQGAIYRLKLTNIPGRSRLDVYPTLEVTPAGPKTNEFLAHNSVPLEFTDDDFKQVVDGNYLVKVIYLPDPKFQDATAGTSEIRSTQLEPGHDPIKEAQRRGTILLVLRMGNVDQKTISNPSQSNVDLARKPPPQLVQPWIADAIEECVTSDNRTPIGPPIAPGACVMCDEPPTQEEILRALPRFDRGVPYLYEVFRDDIEFAVEKLVDKVEAPRFYPLIGSAQLHRCHWKCTVYFTETTTIAYPLLRVQKKCAEVVYIDRDRLHLCHQNPEYAVESAISPLVVLLDDALHPSHKVPGLKGRVYVTRALETVAADGTIKVEMFDANPDARGKPQCLSVWTFTADVLKQLESKDKIGLGYTLFLPCDPEAARVKKVKLQVTYSPREGRAASESATLDLRYTDGDLPAGQTEESAEPPLSAPPKQSFLQKIESLLERVPYANRVINIYSSDPMVRMEQMLIDSENLRQMHEEWRIFWMNDQPSHLTPYRIHGGVGPASSNLQPQAPAKPAQNEQWASSQLANINLQQAERDFKVGEFYQRAGHHGSAVFYFELVCRRYPNTEFAAKALQRKRECELKLVDIGRVSGPMAATPGSSEACEMPAYRVAPPDIVTFDVRQLQPRHNYSAAPNGVPPSPPTPLPGGEGRHAVLQIGGDHLIRPDGTVSLGIYGCVKVDGMTLAQVKNVVEHHLATYFVEPKVAVDVKAYNSQKIYVIVDAKECGQNVITLPCTGNETALDAVAQLPKLPNGPLKIWVARPTKSEPTTLPVDWKAITQHGQTQTNYQLKPGDRVYVTSESVTKVAPYPAPVCAEPKVRMKQLVVDSSSMTIADVVQLAKRGISDDIIIRQMEQTSSTFTLSVADILHLNENGVSDNVIRAMQMRRSQVTPSFRGGFGPSFIY